MEPNFYLVRHKKTLNYAKIAAFNEGRPIVVCGASIEEATKMDMESWIVAIDAERSNEEASVLAAKDIELILKNQATL